MSSDSETNEEDLEQLEAFLVRRFHGGKGKFKGKIPITCYNCNEVGHISARCPKKKNDRWIVGSGCSHHMTGDKSNFITLNYYNGNNVRFGNDAPCLIKRKGSIKLT